MFLGSSLVAQMVKNLSAMWEIQVWSLDEEDPWEKGMATHSSILAWRIPWTQEPGGLQFLGSQNQTVATHSSTLAWRIPWTQEPGRLQSMGSQGVGHNWATSLSLFTFMHWRRKWQPTPVFLPGESQGQGSLVGCPLWGRTESDTTEVT